MKFVAGDLLDFPNGINRIAHSCNTHNTMGAGIAQSIKSHFPYAWQADCIAHQNKKNTLIVLAWNFYKDIVKNNSELSENFINIKDLEINNYCCLLYTSPSPRD